MEEYQELKHVCKLCYKSFPCGRSLGGHMRSHVIYSAEADQAKLNRKKLSSIKNGGNNTLIDTVYGLRENPKKACKFAGASGDTLLHDKVCKECGKSFQSWKALFGHMKCHSDKISQSVEEEGSWTSADRKLAMESQSDTEAGIPNRKKRSSRKIRRYNIASTATTSSSLSINANTSPSVSESEQEQEELAMCLIMLSRDVSHWGGLNSVGDSSGNNSEFLEARASIVFAKIEGKDSVSSVSELVKFKKLRNGKLESSITEGEEEVSAYGNLNRSKPQVDELLDEKLKKSEVGGELELQVLEVGYEKNLKKGSESHQKAELGSKKIDSRKRKSLDLFGTELGLEYSDKKIKFECASCNKSFHSYQALGGHRASHKKLKGCFVPRIDGGEENSICSDQNNLSPNPNGDNNSPIIDQEMTDGSKKINNKGSHECPICFRVFSSGQALGGHKRSHLIAEAKNNQNNIIIQKPIPVIRDFLDLNMPAPAEEESSSASVLVGFKPWWIGSNHKHEPLLSLLSN